MGPALQPHIFVGQGPCALPWVRYGIGGRTGSSAPTEAQQEVQWAGDRKGRPYGSVTRSAGERDDVGIVPYGYITGGAVKRGVEDAAPYGSVTRGAVQIGIPQSRLRRASPL